MTRYAAVAAYLAAIVAANLIAARFGPAVTPFTAFALIGLDLVLRDELHEAWEHRHLVLKMGALILAGSAIAYLVNRDAGPIAVASCVAFAAASVVDTALYALLRRYPKLVRVNGSNVPAAAVDSVLFPTLAFGVFLWPVVLGQFLAKTVGGFVWSLLLVRPRKRHVQSGIEVVLLCPHGQNVDSCRACLEGVTA